MNGPDDVEHMLASGRRGYVHVIRGSVWANGVQLRGGDALKLTCEPAVRLKDTEDAELLVFDLP
jgi:redox-sensitive bicupin YhaK (pirin superfamily)